VTGDLLSIVGFDQCLVNRLRQQGREDRSEVPVIRS
jgi:hypothetical protein